MVIKKTIFRVIAAMVALILLGVGGVLLHQQTKIVPDELLGKALKNTFQAKSYSYKIQSTLYVDGKERPLSDIEGKKDVGDNYHLQGVMLKQPVEVYQVGDTTYLKESNHHQWMVIEENNIMEMEQFVTEVSPLSNFSFSVPEQVDYLGKERLEGRVHYILSCTPNVENRVLKMHWKNFKYKFWVDRRSKIITKSLILSEGSSDAKTTLEMLIELHDLNADFKIKAPKTDKSI